MADLEISTFFSMFPLVKEDSFLPNAQDHQWKNLILDWGYERNVF